MEIKIVSISKWFRTIALMVLTLFSFLLSSCVDVEQYEFYDDVLDDAVVVRNKKSKDDINFGGNSGHRVFNWTCFIVAPTAVANSGLEGYLQNFDWFVRNKRSGDINIPTGGINDSNREWVANTVFGSDGPTPRGGADNNEIKAMLQYATGISYDFHAETNQDSISAFIASEVATEYPDPVWYNKNRKKHFSSSQYVIQVNTDKGLHVAQYSSGGSLVSEPGWANAQSYSVTGYVGVFYPTN